MIEMNVRRSALCATTNFEMLTSRATTHTTLSILVTLAFIGGCRSIIERHDVRPRVLRDVPAQNFAYRLQPDITPSTSLNDEDLSDKLATVQTDFSTKRQDDALLRTVASPDGQRVLALYGTEDEPSSAFRIDLYSNDGRFLRNLIPPDLSCVFPETVAWSPDGNSINFIAHRRALPSPSPTPLTGYEELPSGSPLPSPSVAPAFAPVVSFNTEQIYICNRDGYDLRPLTSREGLIYFYAVWAPDNHALVALACKESEWDAREREFKLPTGRPRLLTLDGKERLLDDELTEALPVWCPDSSKVAAVFEADVMIYDASTTKPTQARIRLHDTLVAASRIHEERNSGGKKKDDSAGSGPDPSAIPASY